MLGCGDRTHNVEINIGSFKVIQDDLYVDLDETRTTLEGKRKREYLYRSKKRKAKQQGANSASLHSRDRVRSNNKYFPVSYVQY